MYIESFSSFSTAKAWFVGYSYGFDSTYYGYAHGILAKVGNENCYSLGTEPYSSSIPSFYMQ